MKVLTEEEGDEEIYDMIQIDYRGQSFKMPKVEAMALLGAFVDEVDRALASEYEEPQKKADGTHQIMSMAKTLDKDECSEVLAINSKNYGECEGINKAIKTIREVRNEFLDV